MSSKVVVGLMLAVGRFAAGAHAAPPATGVAAHRGRLRTTNGLERLNNEIERRTRGATLFPNEASLL